jgi:hypothetical protein
MFKTVNESTTSVLSYNTAPFNQIQAEGTSQTSIHAWSPSAFPVAHYALGPARARMNAVDHPDLLAYQAAGTLVSACCEGVLHLLHPNAEDRLVVQTFSLPGIMTPQHEVSWAKKTSDEMPHSNGFGTLAEAGWSRPHELASARLRAGRAMAIASVGAQVALLYAGERQLELCWGSHMRDR